MSSVSNHDYIELVSTFNVIHNNEFHCGTCKKRASQETRDKKKACSIQSDKEIFQVDEKVFYRRCPANYWSASSQELISIYSKFDKGLLPFKGSLMDQPAKFIDVMSIVERLTIEHQIEMNKKAQKKWQTTKRK